MTFDLQKMLESKRAYRVGLASRPIAEKLRILDILRERELSIRSGGARQDLTVIREEPPGSNTESA